MPTGRDVWVMMQQVPGVLIDRVNVAGNQSARPGRFRRQGLLPEHSTSWTASTSPTTPPTASARRTSTSTPSQELQIATGGSDIRLNTGGVLINVVTKRGTNELKGSGPVLLRAAPAPVLQHPRRGRSEFPGGDFTSNETRFIREYGAEIGAPILVKDRVWIWGAASRQDINLNETGQTDFRRKSPPYRFDAGELDGEADRQSRSLQHRHALLQPQRQARQRPRCRHQPSPGDDLQPARPHDHPEGRGRPGLFPEPLRDRRSSPTSTSPSSWTPWAGATRRSSSTTGA